MQCTPLFTFVAPLVVTAVPSETMSAPSPADGAAARRGLAEATGRLIDDARNLSLPEIVPPESLFSADDDVWFDPVPRSLGLSLTRIADTSARPPLPDFDLAGYADPFSSGFTA